MFLLKGGTLKRAPASRQVPYSLLYLTLAGVNLFRLEADRHIEREAIIRKTFWTEHCEFISKAQVDVLCQP